MQSSDSSRDVILERLAEDFVERHRSGECPPLSEYIALHPELSADIRELFPALVQIEQLKPADQEATGSLGASVASTPGLDRLGDYRILREVGRGGMGVVYEAEQESLGRHVALKVLPSHALLSGTYLERFRREARAAAKLHHTNIVPVFGVGEAEGVHFYAMQFIRGEPLDKILADLRQLRKGESNAVSVNSVASSLITGQFVSPTGVNGESPSASPISKLSDTSHAALSSGLSTSEYHRSVARIGVQVAEALAHAHKQGILHRDIKPSNLLLDAQGRVWITDFGLAKAEGSDELTQAGDIVGTLRFMAPERFDGHSLPQSDVYALGLTLYELLTLQPAFSDKVKAKLIDKILHEPVTPLRTCDSQIPRDLETIVLKCLAKDPIERYSSAEALAEDLDRFVSDRPIKARRSPWYERTWRWCRRNSAVAGLLMTVAVVLLLGIVVTSILAVRADAFARQAMKDRDKADDAAHQQKIQLFESLKARAEAKRLSGRVGQRFETIESIRKAAALANELDMPHSTFDELRNLAISALALPDIRQVNEFPWPKGSIGPAIDDTLEHYACGDGQGNIFVRRIADNVEIARRSGENSINTFAFAEGSKALVLHDSANRSRKLWRFHTTEAIPLGNQPAFFAQNTEQVMTADKKLLVSLNTQTGVISVHDASSGKHLREIRFGKWATQATKVPIVVWDMHPWRHELAITMGDWYEPERQILRILDLDEGKVQTELVTPTRMHVGESPKWHPDGRTLAVPYAQAVYLWDVPTRRFRPLTEHKGGGLSVNISRSGQLMSTYSFWALGVRFWHPYTLKPLLNLPGMGLPPGNPSLDGRMFTYRIADERLSLHVTEPSPTFRVLVRSPEKGPLNGYRRTSVHPNGRLLAVGSTQGVSLFDLANGLDVGHLDLGYNLSVQFDPATGDLLTFGNLGLRRWPVRKVEAKGEVLRIGPPRAILEAPASDNEFRISRDGKMIAVSQHSRVLVLHADQPGKPVILPTTDVRQQLSFSPDGKWIATGTHGGPGIQVWDARTGKLVHEERYKSWDHRFIQFTPDGKKLLTGTLAGCRFLNTDDWRELPAKIETCSNSGWGGTGPLPEFTPEGDNLVWERGDGALRFLSAETGREVVRLECPDQGRCGYTTFTPDGGSLVTVNADYPAVHVWNLRELRKQLREMGLDWKNETLPEGNEQSNVLPPPLPLQIDTGNLGDAAKKRQGALKKNNEAWHLVTDPPRNATRCVRCN